jgi:hypothetical protein
MTTTVAAPAALGAQTAAPAAEDAAPAAPRAMKTPDLTPAQLVAAVGGAVALAVALGAPLSVAKQHEIVLFAVVFAPILITADAFIRHSRAKYLHTALLTAMGAVNSAEALVVPAAGDGHPIAVAAAATGAGTPLPPYIK